MSNMEATTQEELWGLVGEWIRWLVEGWVGCMNSQITWQGDVSILTLSYATSKVK